MAEQTVEASGAVEGVKSQLTLYRTYVGTVATQGKIRLFKAPFAPTIENVLADFVAQEDAFGGYLAVVPTWSALALGKDGAWVFGSSRALFQVTGAPLTETVGGFWVDDGTEVLAFGVFNPPVPMNVVGNYVAIVLEVQGVPGPMQADVDY
jgi:hypothetical protein